MILDGWVMVSVEFISDMRVVWDSVSYIDDDDNDM